MKPTGPLFGATPPRQGKMPDVTGRPQAPGSAPHRLAPLQAADGTGDTNDAMSKSGGGGIPLRKLTKLEQRKMDTIAERQQTNRHEKQIVQRKEYKGAGFALRPSVAAFTDFTVGDQHRCTIDLTNVSYTFNSFKVEALPPQLRAVLEVEYVPQSRMVAGKQASITVIFTPKEAVDIDGTITISTQTGVMELPVQCRTKRSKVVASTRVIDFGSVVVAESSSQRVTLRNEGALPAKLSIDGDALQLFLIEHTMVQATAGRRPSVTGDDVGDDPASDLASGGGSTANLRSGLLAPGTRPHIDTPAPTVPGSTTLGGYDGALSGAIPAVRTCRIISSDPDLAGAAATGKPHTIRLAPFSETSIVFHFTPLEICAFQSSLFLTQQDSDAEDMVLFVKGESVAVPVFISENSTVDYQCAYFDTLYRETFTVTNNTGATAKVTPRIPPSLRGTSVVDFVPKFGFVQPHSTLSFQVKFQPVEGAIMASRQRPGTASTGASQPTAAPHGGVVRFEELVEVLVSDQAMPLFVRLVAAVSKRALRFSDPAEGEVRLGAMYVDERSEVVVLLSNLGGVQRTAGFLQIPANIDVLEPLPIEDTSPIEETAVAAATKSVTLATNKGPSVLARRALRRSHLFYILPQETLRVRLSIAVPGGSVGPFTQQLRVLTEHDDGASLVITGQGRVAPLKLTPSSVWFPPCAVGTHVETVVQLRNTGGQLAVDGGAAVSTSNSSGGSRTPIAFDFLLLRRHGVQVTPQTGVLAPNESIPVRVRFSAHSSIVNLSMPPPIDRDAEMAKLAAEEDSEAERGKTPDKKVKKRSKAEEEADALEKQLQLQAKRDAVEALCRAREHEISQLKKLVQWEKSPLGNQGGATEPWALFRTLQIPCVFRAVGEATSAPTSGAAAVDGKPTAAPPTAKPVFLEVKCTVVKPTLTVRADDTQLSDVALQSPRLTAAALQQPSAAAKVTDKPSKAAPSSSPVGKNIRTKSLQSLGNNSAATKKSGGMGQNAVVGEDEMHMAEQLRQQQEAAEEEARLKESKLRSALTPVAHLDFGSVPSQHAVTKSFTIYHERFPAKVQRFIQEHLFSAASRGHHDAVTNASPHQSNTSDPREVGHAEDGPSRVSSATSKPPLPMKAPTDSEANVSAARVMLCSLPSMRLTVRPLEVGGVFVVSRPPQPLLQPFQSTEVCVTFEPRLNAHYKQTLEVVCDLEGGTVEVPQVRQFTLTCHLSGRGKPASLHITRSAKRQASADPNDGAAGMRAAGSKGKLTSAANGKTDVVPPQAPPSSNAAPMAGDDDGETIQETPEPAVVVGDFGTCCSGDTLELFFDFSNSSDFPLKVVTATTHQTNRNPNGTSPFWVADAGSQIVVPPRSVTTVRLCFAPTVVGVFGCDMRVSYGGSGAFHTLRLLGNCAERPVYVMPPAHPVAIGEMVATPVDVESATATQLPSQPTAVGQLAVSHTPAPTRRSILGDALAALPTAAAIRLGSSPQSPIVLTFTTTATRDFRSIQEPAAAEASSPSKRKAEPKKKSKGNSSARGDEIQHPTGELVPRYAVVSTTATHRFIVGTTRGSTNRGEFAVVGLTSEAVAAGWGCSVVGFGSSCGDAPVAGEVGHGGVGLVGPIGGVFGPLLGAPHAVSATTKGQQDTTGPVAGGPVIVKGMVPPKSAAIIEITYTPTPAVLESLPLEDVDITSVATIRILTKGGGTGPIAPIQTGSTAAAPSPLQRRGSSHNLATSTPRSHSQTDSPDISAAKGSSASSPYLLHPFGALGFLDAEGSTLRDTSPTNMGADGGILYVQLKAVVKCAGTLN